MPALALLLALTGAAPGARAEFEDPQAGLTIEAPPFTIRSIESLRHQAETMAQVAPDLAAKVAADLGLPQATTGTIVLVGPEPVGDMRDVAAGVPPWAAGVTLPSTQAILIRLDRIGGYGQRELLSVLSHELVHLIVAEGLPAHGRELPGWLAEGIASSVAHEGEWRDLWVVWTSPIVSSRHPFADLGAALERGETSKSLAYAGSLAAVGFLESRHGPGVKTRLMAGLKGGLGFDRAFETAAGVSYEEAEMEWARDLNLPWIWVVRIGSSYTVWLVATLLILVAYGVKRVRSKRQLESWGAEEEPEGWRWRSDGDDDDEIVH